jgi:hypothetical protein
MQTRFQPQLDSLQCRWQVQVPTYATENKGIDVRQIDERRQLANTVQDFCCWERDARGLVVSHEIAPLKRFLLIFSDLIFDSSVVRGIPSLAAAPAGP